MNPLDQISQMNNPVLEEKQKDFKEMSQLEIWDLICKSAAMSATQIRLPNNNCRKCYGRGYYAMTKDGPIACPCIFVKNTSSDRDMGELRIKVNNRAERRKDKKNKHKGK